MLDDGTKSHAGWNERATRLIELQSRFVDSAESLAPERRELGGVCGQWSPRELIAHISGWDAEVLRQFDLFKSGFNGAIEHEIESFNQQSVADRAEWSWHATLHELKEIHRAYPPALDSITAVERATNHQYREWLQVLIEHYEHHAAQLQRWL